MNNRSEKSVGVASCDVSLSKDCVVNEHKVWVYEREGEGERERSCFLLYLHRTLELDKGGKREKEKVEFDNVQRSLVGKFMKRRPSLNVDGCH